MGKVKRIDKDEKLQMAINLFRRKGFAQTTMADLVNELSMNRFSLYDAFTDKESLYKESLDYYLKNVVLKDLEPLRSKEAGTIEIVKYFSGFVSMLHRDPHGCLLQNALAERAMSDSDIHRMCDNALDSMASAVCNALVNDIQRGSISKDTDVDALAALVITQLYGMRVVSKVRNMEIVERSMRIIESVFNGLRLANSAV
ncbi:hypothetical protein CS022_19610 [Veronia nyctiphanis]|uniref:HTH tetR-type domain-containing protein n=1 Tax=Veronia nyctiphanis TaxID=1278244 RepID=A0A4Q0YM38_9GAMM|nr:TetR/AcrR family transcriptional regulator [Veronia nyctiphanis]RXJ71776.1 hypothetical protein CS022_19610 [Veronia nyctiphanis]